MKKTHSWKIKISVTLDLKKKMRPGESVIQTLLFIAGFLSIFITLAIVYELGKEAWLFFGQSRCDLCKIFWYNTNGRQELEILGSGRW